MVHPLISSAPSPNIDLSPDIKALYLEASSIMSLSPRWACALLRLALQKLIIQAWGKGKDLNDDIWVLVKGGLSLTIQKALDTVRVIGNNAVHPGVLDINDNIDYVTYMFPLINIIANHFISEPLKISELFEKLPKTVVDGINRRDSK